MKDKNKDCFQNKGIKDFSFALETLLRLYSLYHSLYLQTLVMDRLYVLFIYSCL